MKCPKCKGTMVKGNLHSRRGMISATEIFFIEDGKSKFGLIKKPGTKTTSYACQKCGYLETYLSK